MARVTDYVSQLLARFSAKRDDFAEARVLDEPALICTDETHLELGKRVPLEVLWTVLELLPAGATVFVEGTSIAKDVGAFLTERSQAPERDDLSGTIWPRHEQFHVRLDRALVDGLRELDEHHAEPEMMDHLIVYDGEHVLLAAYDAGMDPIMVSRALPADIRRRIEELVGAGRTQRKSP